MKKQWNAVAAAGLLLACGCAVLTVDVDVYTGPLSNTEEVQTEQVISLVMGAKPLMVQLRDRLEISSRQGHPVRASKAGEAHGTPKSSLQEQLYGFRMGPYYEAGYMAIPQVFHNEHAIRVNEILGLYDDLAPEELQSFIAQGIDTVERYRKAYARFGPESYKADREQWDALEGGDNAPSYSLEPYENVLNLYAGWRRFELLGKRLRSYGNYMDVNVESTTDICEHLVEFGIPEAENAALRKQLSDEELKLLGTRIVQIARDFLNCRAALSDLLDVTLHGLVVVDRLEKTTFRNKDRFIEAGAKIVAKTIRPSKATKYLKGIGDDSIRGLTSLKSLATSEDEVDGEAFARVLEDALRLNTGETALALMQLNALARMESPYGLAYGPVDDAQAFIDNDIAELFQEVTEAAGDALGGGRSPLGLETLIEDYLRWLRFEPDKDYFDERSRSDKFVFLLDAMIAFAQKVVTLGNTATFLDVDASIEITRYVTVLQYVGNAVLVHVDELKHRARHAERLTIQAPATASAFREAGFGSALFATNGFATHLDSKRMLEQLLESIQAEHIRAILDQVPPVIARSEVSGAATNVMTNVMHLTLVTTLTNTASAGASTNVVVFVTGISNGTVVAAGTDGSQVLISATNRFELPVSDKFGQAVAKVIELKNNKIFLRPASAYLRSSYPATTLTVNESVGWQNQLDRQQWRTVPILGALLDNRGRERVKQLRELDKQSWQNINRVRVAGAGDANYVIAKDDIGNWYVKRYSADPTNIIRSARNLAMFAAGDTFGRPLSILGPDGSLAMATNSSLAKQVTRAQEQYRIQTSNTWHRLVTELSDGSFSNTLSIAWGKAGLTSDQTQAVFQETSASMGISTNAVGKGLKAVAGADAKDLVRTLDNEILNVLHSVKRFYVDASVKVATEAEKARPPLAAEVRTFIDRFVDERESSLDRLEASLEIIRAGTD